MKEVLTQEQAQSLCRLIALLMKLKIFKGDGNEVIRAGVGINEEIHFIDLYDKQNSIRKVYKLVLKRQVSKH